MLSDMSRCLVQKDIIIRVSLQYQQLTIYLDNYVSLHKLDLNKF